MKKILILLAVISFAFSSCKKETEVCCTATYSTGQEIGQFCFDSNNERNQWEHDHSTVGNPVTCK